MIIRLAKLQYFGWGGGLTRGAAGSFPGFCNVRMNKTPVVSLVSMVGLCQYRITVAWHQISGRRTATRAYTTISFQKTDQTDLKFPGLVIPDPEEPALACPVLDTGDLNRGDLTQKDQMGLGGEMLNRFQHDGLSSVVFQRKVYRSSFRA